jgi:hypothetical protein
MRRSVAAALLAVGIILASGTSAHADGHFGNTNNYNRGGALLSITANAYGNNSVTWYGAEKVAVSKIYVRTWNYGGSHVGRTQLKPIVDFNGYTLSADSSGAFGVGPYNDSCARAAITEADRSVTYQHDGVACTGTASDIREVSVTNQAAVRFGGVWYGYTVKANYDW